MFSGSDRAKTNTGQVIVHREARGGGVHDGQMAREDLVIGDVVKLHGVLVDAGIGAVNAVDVLGKENGVGVDLAGAEHGGRVRGEIGAAGAAGEEDDLALLQMLDRALAGIGLGKGAHLRRGLDADGNVLLLHHVGDGEAVHDRGEHAHMVGAGALHVAAAVLGAAPEVAAADDHADLHAELAAFLNRVAHAGDHIEIQTGLLLAGQSLTADLEQNAVIFGGNIVHGRFPRFFRCTAFICPIIL